MSITYPDEYLERVKDNNPLLDVVQDYLEIEQHTSNTKNMYCPFHPNDSDPSFKYHEDSGNIYCYGCGEFIGNSFQFIEKMENLHFQEAVQFLIERANMELPDKINDEKYKKKMKKINKFKKLLNYKANKFQKLLLDTDNGEVALEYLVNKRGFNIDDLKKWRLGYCDFSEKDSDRFKKFINRITFPVFDPGGNVVGFSARKIPELDDDNEGRYPKYINSSDNNNPLFNKSKIVYGLNYAKSALRQKDFCILVEGFTDVMSLHKHGVENTVATMGTAITPKQIELIKRYTKNIILFHDGDGAGEKSMITSIEKFEDFDINLRLIKGKNGMDPDEMAAEMKSYLGQWIKENAKTPEKFYVDVAMNKYHNKVSEAKSKLIDELSEKFDEIDNIRKELALETVCNNLNISIKALKDKIEG